MLRKVKGNIWCKIQMGLNDLSRALGEQEWRKKGREGQEQLRIIWKCHQETC